MLELNNKPEGRRRGGGFKRVCKIQLKRGVLERGKGGGMVVVGEGLA